MWCRWGRARNRPLMSLRSPASLGAGPHHSICLLMGDTQTHIACECLTQMHTVHVHACWTTHDRVIHTYTHGDKQSKFQRWSACPYLVAVVIATPGLIPCSRTHRAAACLSSSLSCVSSLLSALFICLSIPSHLILLCHTSQAIITRLIQLC